MISYFPLIALVWFFLSALIESLPYLQDRSQFLGLTTEWVQWEPHGRCPLGLFWRVDILSVSLDLEISLSDLSLIPPSVKQAKGTQYCSFPKFSDG